MHDSIGNDAHFLDQKQKGLQVFPGPRFLRDRDFGIWFYDQRHMVRSSLPADPKEYLCLADGDILGRHSDADTSSDI